MIKGEAENVHTNADRTVWETLKLSFNFFVVVFSHRNKFLKSYCLRARRGQEVLEI